MKVRYDFYKLMGTTEDEFTINLSRGGQIDFVNDKIDDLSQDGQWDTVNQIYEEFDPDEHPTALAIMLLTVGSAPFRDGKIKEETWRAFYHRCWYRAKKDTGTERLPTNREFKLLLKGFPTAYLADKIKSVYVRIVSAWTELET